MATPRRTGNVAGPRRTRRRKPTAVVTYRGPDDPKDKTRTVILPHHNPRRDEHFPIDRPVETTISSAKRLAAMAGHTFTIEPARPEGGM